jgi:hypothetical protein
MRASAPVGRTFLNLRKFLTLVERNGMNQKAGSKRVWEITIDSNWIITIGMALLFAITAFLLGWSIRDLLFGKVEYGILHGVRRGWLDTLTNPIGAIYFFLFAYSFPAKHLKVAFLLLGANYTVLVALTYLPVAAGVQHFVAVAGSIATQIAYTIILLAIAQWFRSVVRWNTSSEPGP